MKKSDITSLPSYYDRYIQLNDDIDLDEAFSESLKQIHGLDIEQLQRIGLKVYAQDKWTIHKIFQHLIDWERIWCYRTLVAVRNEGTIPPGLDHNKMADNSNADDIPIEQLIDELIAIRMATIAMFDGFDDDILTSNCKFSDNEMSILAMGYNIIGHQIHHFNILEERYLPLDPFVGNA